MKRSLVIQLIGPTTSFTGLALKPWTERPDITDRDSRIQMMQYLIKYLAKYQVLMAPSLPIMKSMVNQLVIKSPDSPERIYQVAEQIELKQ